MKNSSIMVADYLEGRKDFPSLRDIENQIALEKFQRRVEKVSFGKSYLTFVAILIVFITSIIFLRD